MSKLIPLLGPFWCVQQGLAQLSLLFFQMENLFLHSFSCPQVLEVKASVPCLPLCPCGGHCPDTCDLRVCLRQEVAAKKSLEKSWRATTRVSIFTSFFPGEQGFSANSTTRYNKGFLYCQNGCLFLRRFLMKSVYQHCIQKGGGWSAFSHVISLSFHFKKWGWSEEQNWSWRWGRP